MQRNEPLYRKENTLARGAKHGGGDYKWFRNSKSSRNDLSMRGAMHGKRRLSYDYTPLFKFLLSRVGQRWVKVHSDAVARLDKEEPIFWLIARTRDEGQDYICVGESTYYSGLFVDESGVLSVVNPNLKLDDMKPVCGCCTHTFNGVTFTRKFLEG